MRKRKESRKPLSEKSSKKINTIGKINTKYSRNYGYHFQQCVGNIQILKKLISFYILSIIFEIYILNNLFRDVNYIEQTSEMQEQ
jgi:hypothetical protein